MSYRRSILPIVAVIGFLAWPGCSKIETRADAQAKKCTTVMECAQQAVEIATKLNETVKLQQQEIANLRKQLETDVSNRPKNVEFKECTFMPDWTSYGGGTNLACPAGKVLRGAKLAPENPWRMILECCSVGFAK